MDTGHRSGNRDRVSYESLAEDEQLRLQFRTLSGTKNLEHDLQPYAQQMTRLPGVILDETGLSVITMPEVLSPNWTIFIERCQGHG